MKIIKIVVSLFGIAVIVLMIFSVWVVWVMDYSLTGSISITNILLIIIVGIISISMWLILLSIWKEEWWR